MREIKFRGKRKSSRKNCQKWIYGSLYIDCGECFINYQLPSGDIEIEDVLKDTVGQYTGLKDKNGVEIYEGDILNNTAVNFKFIVKFENTKYVLQKVEFPEDILDMYSFLNRIPTMFEVIGNIYDK